MHDKDLHDIKKAGHAKEGTFTSVERTLKGAEHVVLSYRDSAFHRFPILFATLALFGGVVTVFGFEQLLSQIALFSNHPVFTLLLGLMILGFTGALYKKLS